MVLDLKTFQKEEWARVVPFAKHQNLLGKNRHFSPSASRGSLAQVN